LLGESQEKLEKFLMKLNYSGDAVIGSKLLLMFAMTIFSNEAQLAKDLHAAGFRDCFLKKTCVYLLLRTFM